MDTAPRFPADTSRAPAEAQCRFPNLTSLERAFREYVLSVFSDRFEQFQGWIGAEIDWENSAVVGGERLTIIGVRYTVGVSVLRQHLDEWIDTDASMGTSASIVRAQQEYQSPDWSLENVLSWIAFRDPALICQYEGYLNVSASTRLRRWG